MEKHLKTRQICLFFITFLVVNKLFTLPSTVSFYAKEDLWISAGINLLVDFLTLLALLLIGKNTNLTFYELLEICFKKIGAKIVAGLYFLYFFVKSILPILEQKEYIDLTLYTSYPSFIYFVPFFIIAILLGSKKIRVLGRLSDALFLTTIIGFSILMALSIPHADFSNLLPVGAVGAKMVIRASYLSLNWFGDVVYFFMFIGTFNYKKKDGLKILTSYIISALSVILFYIVFYCIFSSIAERQKFSLTEISKYTTIINSTGRFDYFAILLLLITNVISISLPLFFCAKILDYIFNVKNRFLSPLIITSSICVLVVILGEYVYSAQRIILSFLGPVFLFMGNLFPILILILGKKGAKNATIKG